MTQLLGWHKTSTILPTDGSFVLLRLGSDEDAPIVSAYWDEELKIFYGNDECGDGGEYHTYDINEARYWTPLPKE